MLSGWWLIFAVFFWAGLIFGWPIWISATFFSLVLIALFRGRWKDIVVAWVSVFLVSSVGVVSGTKIVSDWRKIIKEGMEFTICGVVRTIDLTDSRKAFINAKWIWIDGKKYVFPYKMWVWKRSTWQTGDVGKRFRFQVRVSGRKTLWVSGVLFEVERSWLGWIYWAVYKLRRMAYRNMRFLPPDVRTLLSSVLLGVRGQHFFSMYKKFASVGLAHILAISGLHLAILSGICFVFLQFFVWDWRIVLFFVTLFSWIYSLMIPESSSLLRAVVMLTWFTISYIFRRRWSIYDILGLTLFTVAFFDPLQLFSKGFIMSFGAVLSICLGLSLFGWVGWIEWFLVGVFATVGLFGVIVRWFGCVSILGALFSPIAVILLSWIIFGAIIFTVSGGFMGRHFVEVLSSWMLLGIDWLIEHNVVWCRKEVSQMEVIYYYFWLMLVVLVVGWLEWRKCDDEFGGGGFIGD